MSTSWEQGSDRVAAGPAEATTEAPAGAGSLVSSLSSMAPLQRAVLQRKILQRWAGRAGAAPNAAPSEGGGGDGSWGNLPDAVRGKMEHAFGADFSGVRVHQGGAAAEMNALAFTQGDNIHFAPGRYDPSSGSGQALLGHELAHVVQQREGRVSATTQDKGVDINEDESLEREADDLGSRAARGEVVARGSAATTVEGGATQRYSAERVTSGAGPVQFNGYETLNLAIESLSEPNKKHICVAKHAWDQVIDDFEPAPGEKDSDQIPEGMWDKVKAIMLSVVTSGTEMEYKGKLTKKKVMVVNSKTVEVIYAKLSDGFRVSNAWVATGGGGE